MQVSGNFRVPADWSWLVLVGAVVGDFLASDDAPWLAVVTRAAASSREAMPNRSVRKQPCVVVQRGRSRFMTQQACMSRAALSDQAGIFSGMFQYPDPQQVIDDLATSSSSPS